MAVPMVFVLSKEIYKYKITNNKLNENNTTLSFLWIIPLVWKDGSVPGLHCNIGITEKH